MPHVILRKHSRLWKWRFLKEKFLLRLLIGNQNLDIEHFGSTSIPRMIAKPIIDIQVGVPNFEPAFRYVSRIERLGYTYNGENGEFRQYYFTRGKPTRFRLYVVERSAETWRRRTTFRDYLKDNRAGAERYAELKQELAIRYPENIQAYQDGKLEFVAEIIGRAESI